MTTPGGTSGTYAFNPSLGELVQHAFSLLGIRRTQLLQEHMADARMAVNLLQADWQNKGVNLFQVEQIQIPLIQGVSLYSLDPTIFVMLDTYVVQSGYGTSSEIDRIILPISRTEYASYPNKQQQGFPTVFWMNRQLSPTVTLWPVPNGTVSTMVAYVLKQAQDANYANGQNVAVPYAWLKAVAYGIAEGLAPIYAPERLEGIAAASQAAYTAAAAAGIETAQQYIAPQLQGYFRT